MADTMRRVKLTAPKQAVVEEVPKPKPGPEQILMKIAYSGICGSDLHASIGKHPFVPLPATPGHEFSGWVDEIGEGVSGFKKGDRVTSEPNLVCGVCYNCRIGRYNICESLRVMGCQGDGAMADYFLLPANKTVSIPANLSLKHAALVEPVAVGTHATHRAGDLFMKNVVIVGSGMIGLGVLACVVQAGAANIWVTDFDDSRLKLAKEMGATKVVNAKEDIIKIIKKEAGYEGVDVVFECVGIGAALRTSMDLIRKGGKVIVMGVYGDEATIKAADLQDREMELIGTLMYTMRDVKEAIKLIADKKVPSDKIIGKVFTIDQCNEAFEYARDHKENIKTVIEINKE
jgi:L-iditol 2-dehydrogenase